MRKPKNFVHRTPEMHSLLRWPLLITSGLIIFILLFFYAVVRWIIIAVEGLLEALNMGNFKGELENVQTYREYKKIASKIDRVSGLSDWKKNNISPFYNHKLVEKQLSELLTAREKNDVPKIVNCLSFSLSDPNFAGIFNEQLYSQCFDGTKNLIQDFINTIVMSLYYLRDVLKRSDHTDHGKLIDDLVKRITFGSTALCLSGGGSLCMQHIGVVNALIEGGVIPKVLCGTSGGSVVGALFATRTSEELKRDLAPENLLKMSRAFGGTWITRFKRLIRVGEMFDPENAYAVLGEWCNGDMTFKEAFLKTGILFNVTVTHHGNYADTGAILNHITAPNVIIRSAVLSSSSFPLLFKPVRIREKDPNSGQIREREALKYSDGSLVTDIPKDKLVAMCGVRFTVVSQVNPHITPFFFNLRGSSGNPLMWRWGSHSAFRGGFILAALEVFFKEQLKMIFRVIRSLDIGPKIGGSPWVMVFLQNFSGDLTLSNTRNYFYKLFHSLENPRDEESINWWIREGLLMTWPKVSQISGRIRIENAIQDLLDVNLSM